MKQRANDRTSATTRDLNDFDAKTHNIYESVAILSQRANQIAVLQKNELQDKIQELSNISDSNEEFIENKEQTDLVRFYEQQPKPAIVAIEEFLNNKIYYRIPEKKKK